MGTNTDTAGAKAIAAVNLASDTTLAGCRAIYVGVTGDVKVDAANGGTATFKSHPVGYLQVQASKIYSTANGTTATDLIVLY